MSADSNRDPVEAVGHERRDVNASSVAIFVLILQACMLACCILGLIFHQSYKYWMRISGTQISPMAQYVAEPPTPRLQVDPSTEMQAFRDSQGTIATSYGWVDTDHGIVRLPIERAKELIAERQR